MNQVFPMIVCTIDEGEVYSLVYFRVQTTTAMGDDRERC